MAISYYGGLTNQWIQGKHARLYYLDLFGKYAIQLRQKPKH